VRHRVGASERESRGVAEGAEEQMWASAMEARKVDAVFSGSSPSEYFLPRVRLYLGKHRRI
jgi:hypothetical protein